MTLGLVPRLRRAVLRRRRRVRRAGIVSGRFELAVVSRRLSRPAGRTEAV